MARWPHASVNSPLQLLAPSFGRRTVTGHAAASVARPRPCSFNASRSCSRLSSLHCSIYNALVVHALVVFGPADGSFSR